MTQSQLVHFWLARFRQARFLQGYLWRAYFQYARINKTNKLIVLNLRIELFRANGIIFQRIFFQSRWGKLGFRAQYYFQCKKTIFKFLSDA